MTKSMKKVLQGVPLEVSIHWRYLHQDGRKTWLEISKMKSYGKYSKATICRIMVKKIRDLVLDKRKQNQFNAKGSHEGTGGSEAHLMAAIAYGKGVIAAEQYFERINADTFSSFVHEHFANMFKKLPNPNRKLFLQDGGP